MAEEKQKYWISNGLTGSHTYGESLPDFLDNCLIINSLYQKGKMGYYSGTGIGGYKEEYSLREQQFYVLDEHTSEDFHFGYINLQNVETGVVFWMSNFALRKTPVSNE